MISTSVPSGGIRREGAKRVSPRWWSRMEYAAFEITPPGQEKRQRMHPEFQ